MREQPQAWTKKMEKMGEKNNKMRKETQKSQKKIPTKAKFAEIEKFKVRKKKQRNVCTRSTTQNPNQQKKNGLLELGVGKCIRCRRWLLLLQRKATVVRLVEKQCKEGCVVRARDPKNTSTSLPHTLWYQENGQKTHSHAVQCG